MFDTDRDFALALIETDFLQRLELGDIFFAMIAQAALLQGEVTEIAPVMNGDAGTDQSGASDRVFLFAEFSGQFAQAETQDGGFQRSDAEETPSSIGDCLYESVFIAGNGCVLCEVTIDVLAIG